MTLPRAIPSTATVPPAHGTIGSAVPSISASRAMPVASQLAASCSLRLEATATNPLNTSRASQASLRVIIPPFDMPVTNTRVRSSG